MRSPLVLVGEAPGFNEDIEGKPFVGQSGDLLDFILSKMGLSRDRLYITNVLKCRPPKNKLPSAKPLKECLEQCYDYLAGELEIIKPRAVVTLGVTATKSLLGYPFVSKVEGMVFEKDQTKGIHWNIVPAFHPAAVLRNPGLEKNLATALWVAAGEAGLKLKAQRFDEVFDYPPRKK
jgi:DNA polymerase